MKILLASGLAALLASPALAGVSIRQSVESSGVHGNGAFQSESSLEFDGLKARKARTLKFTGQIMSFISGKKGKTSLEIDRVDLDKRWALNPKRKTYAESSISLPPQKNTEDESAPETAAPQNSSPSQIRVIKTEFDVKDTGETKRIGDFSTNRYAVSYMLETQDSQTGQTQTYRMKTDVWATPWTKELREASDEQAAFNRAYLEKLGLGISPEQTQDFGFKLLALMTGSGGADLAQSEAEFKAKAARIQGYPIEIDARWYQAQQSAQPAQAQSDDGSQNADADLSGGASQVAANLFGGLAKKMARQELEKNDAGADAPAFSIKTVVESLKVGSLPETDFEIPAGYRKNS